MQRRKYSPPRFDSSRAASTQTNQDRTLHLHCCLPGVVHISTRCIFTLRWSTQTPEHYPLYTHHNQHKSTIDLGCVVTTSAKRRRNLEHLVYTNFAVSHGRSHTYDYAVVQCFRYRMSSELRTFLSRITWASKSRFAALREWWIITMEEGGLTAMLKCLMR
jgi:hypothetical protein